MAKGDNQFDTGTGFEQGGDLSATLKSFQGFLERNMGPGVAGPMMQMAGPMINNMLHGTMTGPGGNAYMGAPNAITGAFGLNPGVSAYHTLNNQTMSAQMQGTQGVLNEALRQQNQNLHQWMGSSTAQADSSGFNITNMLSSMQFQLHKPQQLLQGMEETQRYMGAGSLIGLSRGAVTERQSYLNKRARGFTEGIATDFINNTQDYQGFTGLEVGQISAEVGRSGQADTLPKATQQVKQMARTIKSLQQFFKGDVGDLIDQINGLTGTDFQATFGAKSGRMLDRSAGIGFATGHTNQQMMSLAGMSARAAQGMGGDTFGAIANSQDIASILGAVRTTGSSAAFTNEQTVRAGIVNMVTDSQQSIRARDASGMYAMLLSRGETEADASAFMSSLEGQGMKLNGSTMAAAAAKAGFGDISAQDLRNASGSDVAMKYRSDGRATTFGMSARMDRMQRVRNQTLGGILRQYEGTGGILKGLQGNINGKSLSAALEGHADKAAIMGQFRTVDNLSSQALFGMSSREADRMVMAMANEDELTRISEQAGVRVDFTEMAQGMGTLGGLRSITEMAKKRPDSFSGFMQQLMGDVNLDMTDPKIAAKARKKYGEISQNMGALSSALSGKGDLNMTAKRRAAAAIGLSSAMQVLSTGKIGGKFATDEQIDEAKAIFANEGGVEAQANASADFAENADPATMERMAIEEEAAKLLKGIKKPDAAAQKLARRRAGMIRRGAKYGADDYDMLSVSGTGSAKETMFKDTINARADAARSMDKDALKDFWEVNKGTPNLMDEKAFNDMNRKEQAYNTGLGGTGAEKTNALMQMIVDMMSNFMNKN